MNGEYYFRKLQPGDFEEVFALLENVYLKNEPMASCLGQTTRGIRAGRTLEVQKALTLSTSLGAFAKSNDALVAMIMSSFRTDDQGETLKENDEKALITKRIHKFVGTVLPAEGIVKFLKHKDDKYLYLRGVACQKEHTKKGISTELLRRIEEIARDGNCKAIIVITASHYLQLMVAKLDYITAKEVSLQNYVDPVTNEKIFANIQKPHHSLSLQIKYL